MTSINDFVPKDFQKLALERFQSVFRTGEQASYQTEYLTAEGDTQYFDVRLSPVTRNGKVVSVVSSSNNVTQRKLANDVLHQYEHIVSSSTDMLALLDKRFTYLAANETYMNAFKLTPEQLIDHKALVGDNSDNIPGLRGIGNKTATRLLKQYGSIEGIYPQNVISVSNPFRIPTEGDGAGTGCLLELVIDVDIQLCDGNIVCCLGVDSYPS